MQVQKYVLGFLFGRSSVLLIQKSKPPWQRGLLNGIGGKVEEADEAGEASATVLNAMNREAEEEAGLVCLDWKAFCVMGGPGWEVTCFMCQIDDEYLLAEYDGPAQQKEEEELFDVSLEDIRLHRRQTVSNISWLVEMALDRNHGKPSLMYVRYGGDRIE